MEAALNGPAGGMVGGILGAAMGETAAQTDARIQEVKKTAKDLTGLVRKKAKEVPVPAAEANGSSEANGKRKAEVLADGDVDGDEAKKTKVQDATEAQ